MQFGFLFIFSLLLLKLTLKFIFIFYVFETERHNVFSSSLDLKQIGNIVFLVRSDSIATAHRRHEH